MPEFRLTQISDTHLARRFASLTDNFHRVSEHIDATRPDLVVNSGDLAFDGADQPDDLEFARDAARCASGSLPLSARQSRHRRQPDRGRPAAVRSRSRKRDRQSFHRGLRRGPLALRRRRLVLYRAQFAGDEYGLASEAEQFDWLASELAGANGKPVALFLHKPLFLNTPDDPELEAIAIRYVPHAGAAPADRDVRTPSICGWSPAATCISAAISPIATSATSGRPRPASSFQTPAGT